MLSVGKIILLRFSGTTSKHTEASIKAAKPSSLLVFFTFM